MRQIFISYFVPWVSLAILCGSGGYSFANPDQTASNKIPVPYKVKSRTEAVSFIFSPENYSAYSNVDFSAYDSNGDGVLAMEDLNSSDKPKWKTLFFVPATPANYKATSPAGSFTNPFIITNENMTKAGGFYQLIQSVTISQKGGLGLNCEVVFLPGIYSKLQFILRNGDTSGDKNASSLYPTPILGIQNRTAPANVLIRVFIHLPPTQDTRPSSTAERWRLAASFPATGPLLNSTTNTIDGFAGFMRIEGDVLRLQIFAKSQTL